MINASALKLNIASTKQLSLCICIFSTITNLITALCHNQVPPSQSYTSDGLTCTTAAADRYNHLVPITPDNSICIPAMQLALEMTQGLEC